jgi:diguanylate cyclase (GGDEF)-like protein
VIGAVAGIAYAAPLGAAVDSAAFLSVGLATIAALVLGPRMHRPSPAWPWHLIAVAGVLFLVGALVRPWAAEQAGAATAMADVFTLPGYGFLAAALLGLLRTGRGIDLHALTDGITVSTGAALLSLTLFAVPASEVVGRPGWMSLLAATYPVLDVVLLLLLLSLAFTTALDRPSYRMLTASIVLIFIGDICYAWIGREGRIIGPQWMDLPFLAAYVMMGLAAMHPSIADMSANRARPVQAWSAPRLAAMSASLAVPPLLLIANPSASTTLRVASALAGAIMVGALLVRAVYAVKANTVSEKALLHRATHDMLTGLINRDHLMVEIDRMFRQRRSSVALLYVDLDGFKLVNDNWGHGTGDQLLVDVAERLRSTLGPEHVVARTGGDEFVVALHLLGHEAGEDAALGAAALAQRVELVLRAPFIVSEAEIYVTASIGVAVAAQASGETMMRDADTAMYSAKAGGRDRVVHFDAAMHETVRTRVDMELALRHALARDQFSICFMPVVDLTSEALLGFEALLRWDHPKLGRVSPDSFIPVAEDTGLIVPIGEWVLRAGVRQLAAWRHEYPHLASGPQELRLSVNVSARQLRDGGLVESVVEVLTLTGVPPQCLCLEITESAILTDTQSADDSLRELVALGVSVSVDDFGTGYSSLGYLRRFPVDEVKIDRAFVSGLGTSSEDEEIVRAVTAMGHALGLAVVAEGVETLEHRDILRTMGVDRAQGWLYGKPQAAQEISFPPRAAGIRSAAQLTGGGNSYAQ